MYEQQEQRHETSRHALHALPTPESTLQQTFSSSQEVAFGADCRFGYSEHFPPNRQTFGEFDDDYEHYQDSPPI